MNLATMLAERVRLRDDTPEGVELDREILQWCICTWQPIPNIAVLKAVHRMGRVLGWVLSTSGFHFLRIRWYRHLCRVYGITERGK